MSNKLNPRRKGSRKTERRLDNVRGCGGLGRNGAIGKRSWKKLSRRSVRRARGTKVPKVAKWKGRPVLDAQSVLEG